MGESRPADLFAGRANVCGERDGYHRIGLVDMKDHVKAVRESELLILDLERRRSLTERESADKQDDNPDGDDLLMHIIYLGNKIVFTLDARSKVSTESFLILR